MIAITSAYMLYLQVLLSEPFVAPRINGGDSTKLWPIPEVKMTAKCCADLDLLRQLVYKDTLTTDITKNDIDLRHQLRPGAEFRMAVTSASWDHQLYGASVKAKAEIIAVRFNEECLAFLATAALGLSTRFFALTWTYSLVRSTDRRHSIYGNT